MNIFTKMGCRIFQQSMRLAMFLLPWNQCKKTLSGPGSISQLPKFLKDNGFKSILIVTDGFLFSSGKADPIMAACEAEGMKSCCYHDVVPNPTIQNIEEGLKMYHDNNCDAIVALGGGSAMDCAKGIGARVACPKKSVPQMKGVLKIMITGHKLPPLVAIPTTSGTGSETTVAAVITDRETNHKCAIMDLNLIPHYAILDPELTVGLPPRTTATTGMDALTHAVEAYLCWTYNTRESIRDAEEAVQSIFVNLEKVYAHPEDLNGRQEMMIAAFKAGFAFTRSSVGNVHAIAHTLGGLYNTPHGLANAVILPIVLEDYGEAVYPKLARLAEIAKVKTCGTTEEKAKEFIAEIRAMNKRMGIPEGLDVIKDKDIPQMVKWALAEANPVYPVPVVYTKERCASVIRRIQKGQ
mgnify:CR=1 FL=1